jgi:hypothetical protein
MAAELDVDDAIIDGEVIGADETGRSQFYDLLRSTRAPTYVGFARRLVIARSRQRRRAFRLRSELTRVSYGSASRLATSD